MKQIQVKQFQQKLKHRCAMCAKSEHGDTEATGLFIGKFWNEELEKVMPYKGYLCDMHSDEAESGSFVS